jgi:hypothetical protein
MAPAPEECSLRRSAHVRGFRRTGPGAGLPTRCSRRRVDVPTFRVRPQRRHDPVRLRPAIRIRELAADAGSQVEVVTPDDPVADDRASPGEQHGIGEHRQWHRQDVDDLLRERQRTVSRRRVLPVEEDRVTLQIADDDQIPTDEAPPCVDESERLGRDAVGILRDVRLDRRGVVEHPIASCRDIHETRSSGRLGVTDRRLRIAPSRTPADEAEIEVQEELGVVEWKSHRSDVVRTGREIVPSRLPGALAAKAAEAHVPATGLRTA